MNRTMPMKWKSRIPELLEAKGDLLGRKVSPEELAQAIGVTRQTIYTWIAEEGVPTISADKTAKLMEFFGVPEWRLWSLQAADDTELGEVLAVG